MVIPTLTSSMGHTIHKPGYAGPGHLQGTNFQQQQQKLQEDHHHHHQHHHESSVLLRCNKLVWMVAVLYLCIWQQGAILAEAAPEDTNVVDKWVTHGEGQEQLGKLPSGMMCDLVCDEGYPLEKKLVETSDGYILEVYRIPHGRSNDSSPDKPVVLLWHGVLDSSAGWVLNGPKESLGFILADAGFDVWLANSRGNAYSRRHSILTVDSDQFWDFTFEEMAMYDVPAAIDYILEQTGASTIAYAAHSQGAGIFFLACSIYPELARKVSVAVMVAPVVYVTYMSSYLLKFLGKYSSDSLAEAFGRREFMGRLSETNKALAHMMCSVAPGICLDFVATITGSNPENFNMSRMDIYMQYSPSGTSVKTLEHWDQEYQCKHSKCFQRYDYGTECWDSRGWPQKCNQKVYGQEDPPAYNISSNYHVPTAFFWGGKDLLSDPVDVTDFIGGLPYGAVLYKQFIEEYCHLDFVLGIDAYVKLYPKVTQLLRDANVSSSRL